MITALHGNDKFARNAETSSVLVDNLRLSLAVIEMNRYTFHIQGGATGQRRCNIHLYQREDLDTANLILPIIRKLLQVVGVPTKTLD